MLSIEEKIFLAEISALLSSMGTLFPPMCTKNQCFFKKEIVISAREAPQQHPSTRQRFGGHIAEKQLLLFLLPTIVDFIKR